MSGIKFSYCCATITTIRLQNLFILNWNCLPIRHLTPHADLPQALAITILLCFHKFDSSSDLMSGIIQLFVFLWLAYFT